MSSRSLKVATLFIEQVRLALKRQGYLRQIDLAEDLMMSRSTVSNFFNGNSIYRQNFLEICDRLNLDWEEIVDWDDKETINSSVYSVPMKREKFINSPQNIPRSGAIEFVGREKVLEELHQQLQQNQTIAIIAAITGMGGLGKTELALQYAQRQWEKGTYPGGICWLGARQADLGSQIVSFGRTLLKLTIPENLNLLESVQYCWDNWIEGKVLIVLDDVVDYEEIKPYLPPTESRFLLLLTTRLKLGAFIRQLNLEVLKPRAALALLKSLVGRDRLKEEPWVARRLCKWLGYLPLGLELVGRFLSFEEDLSLAEMLDELQQISLKADALVETDEDMTAERGVAATFELSWQRLEEKARLLGFCLSLFAVAPISWSLVEAVKKEENTRDLRKLRGVLVKFNLLKRVGKETYQLHSLIKEFFRGKLEELASVDDYKSSFCQVMVGKAKEIPEKPIRKDIEAVSSSIPHLKEAATTFSNWITDEDLIWPFFCLGRFYEGQGDYEEARPWFEQCLSITRDRLGEKHLDVADSLNNLAELYLYQGRYQEAEPLYLEALEMRKQLLGPQHPSVATSFNNLALLYQYQGKYQQAEPLYLQALEMRKQLLGQEHPDVATSFNNLAELYLYQGKYQQAEPLCLQALEMRKQLLGEKHPDVATSLNNLAELYLYQGNYKQAEPLYLQALEMRKQLLGEEEHPDVANSLNNLAGLYLYQGKYQQAEPLCLQALEMTKQLLGQQHPDVATSLNNLGLLYCSQGKYQQAEPLYLQALEMRQKLLGEQHPDVAKSLNNLALLYSSQGKYQQARPLYRQALDILERKLGTNHPNTVLIRRNLENLDQEI